jgi:hypothetical protein
MESENGIQYRYCRARGSSRKAGLHQADNRYVFACACGLGSVHSPRFASTTSQPRHPAHRLAVMLLRFACIRETNSADSKVSCSLRCLALSVE